MLIDNRVGVRLLSRRARGPAQRGSTRRNGLPATREPIFGTGLTVRVIAPLGVGPRAAGIDPAKWPARTVAIHGIFEPFWHVL